MGSAVSFGILIPQDAPFDELGDRWQRAEELGFDAVYVADHTGDYRDLDAYWLDGWTVLTHVAPRTRRVRTGTLVANPLLHHPVQLARQAVALDNLTGGRLELGIGTGIAGFDHEAVGAPYWSPRQRVARFAEYVAVVDGALRSKTRTFRHDGDYFRTTDVAMTPPPVQQPRPPITIAGQSPTVLRVAARYGDCWNTHGPFGYGVEEIAQLTARQNGRLDELCRENGRDPGALRRSLLLYDRLDAWAADDAFEHVVERFRAAGMSEFVVFWPPDGELARLERAARRIPALRD